MSTPGLFNLDQRLGMLLGAHLWWIMQFGDALHHLGARCRVLASKVIRFPSHMRSSKAFHYVWITVELIYIYKYMNLECSRASRICGQEDGSAEGTPPFQPPPEAGYAYGGQFVVDLARRKGQLGSHVFHRQIFAQHGRFFMNLGFWLGS